MLDAALQGILERVGPDEVVLDIGAWGRPLTRADWVMDLMPYETRGLYGRDGPEPERFSSETWIRRDVCDRQPYPFADKEIDFVVCSHTLEDVRDPIWVCDEMVRIAKRGYVEVPSRLEEQSYGFQGPWAGWGHHRWLIDMVDGRLDFVFKHHVLHNRDSDRFPPGFQQTLRPEERVVSLWWEDSFAYRERVFVAAEELDPYLADFVASHRRRAAPARRGLLRLRRRPRPRAGS
jgi:SAM-dependent methyltransferase